MSTALLARRPQPCGGTVSGCRSVRRQVSPGSPCAQSAPHLEDEIKQIPSTSSLCKKANEHISQIVKLFLLEQ
ncbi:hypothetical protein EYF80_008128 [Liparis tanakae]|uniref:Uncharacterized protein n=1 Tax=Liparis tanakae TaxID=230148 RepID=A0A4Z2IWM7_9TELE|nr:hypothetical protein EYF80_008128 [Liparis tanakae]